MVLGWIYQRSVWLEAKKSTGVSNFGDARESIPKPRQASLVVGYSPTPQQPRQSNHSDPQHSKTSGFGDSTGRARAGGVAIAVIAAGHNQAVQLTCRGCRPVVVLVADMRDVRIRSLNTCPRPRQCSASRYTDDRAASRRARLHIAVCTLARSAMPTIQ